MLTFEQFNRDVQRYDLKLMHEPFFYEALFHEANGCGKKGGKKFPGHILWVDVTVACFVHDIDWHLSESIAQIKEGNENFDNNVKRITDVESKNLFMQFTRRQVLSYAVSGIELIGSPQYIKEVGLES